MLPTTSSSPLSFKAGKGMRWLDRAHAFRDVLDPDMSLTKEDEVIYKGKCKGP